MSLDRVPLLTRGSFALLFGGENIIEQLSPGSPGHQESFQLLYSFENLTIRANTFVVIIY